MAPCLRLGTVLAIACFVSGVLAGVAASCNGHTPVSATASTTTVAYPSVATDTYPANLVCEWNITGTPGQRLQFDWVRTSFDATAVACPFDSLTIYDGGDDSAQILTRLCTNLPAYARQIVTTGFIALVRFVSDASGAGNGFEFRVATTGANGYYSCFGAYAITGQPSGTVFDPFPSPGACHIQYYRNCSWLITAPMFVEFDTTSTYNLGSTDLFMIYDGSTRDAPLLGSYTGTHAPGHTKHYSTGTTLLVYTETQNSPYIQGFSATFTARSTSVNTCTNLSPEPMPVYLSGRLDFPYPYDGTTPYGANQDCLWLIQAPNYMGVNRINITITSFYLVSDCSDYLAIYDGPDTTSPILVMLCGTSLPAVVSYVSSRDKVMVRLHSNAATQNFGFSLRWTTFLAPILQCQNVNGGLFYNNYGGMIESPITFDDFTKLQISPGQTCTWTFFSNTRIEVTAAALKLDLGGQGCRVQGLEFFDGADTSAPLHARLCTADSTLYVRSSGPWMTVRLFSNVASNANNGFMLRATNSSVSPSHGYCTDVWRNPAVPRWGAFSQSLPYRAGTAYPNNLNCTWLLDAQNDNAYLMLSFVAFKLTTGDTLFGYDDAALNDDLRIFTLQYDAIPSGPTYSTGRYFSLQFLSDASGSTTNKEGFLVVYTFIHCADIPAMPGRIVARTALTATVSCDASNGYLYSSTPTQVLTCLSVNNGTWDAAPQTCTLATCAHPGDPANGHANNASATFVYNDQLTFSCIPGKVLNSAAAIHCGISGWIGTIPTCNDPGNCASIVPLGLGVACAPLGQQPPGTIATCFCGAGYTLTALSSNSTFSCLPSTEWNGGGMPSCVALPSAPPPSVSPPPVAPPPLAPPPVPAPVSPLPTCAEPVLTNGGCTISTTATTEVTAVCQCALGYLMVGPGIRRCLADGSWEPLPSCIQDAQPTRPPPVISDVQPKLVPLLGGDVMILGDNWQLPLRGITVGGAPVDMENVTVHGVGGGEAVAVVMARRLLGSDGNSATFRARGASSPGYQRVVVTDGYGLEASADAMLYFSDDCPSAGEYGVGADCRACPKGAECPGGNRMWPLPGYWNEGEQSGYVEECPETSTRCLGGRTSACAPGYEGPLCGSCSAGFYDRGSECAPCPPEESRTALYVVNAILFALLAVAFVALPDSYLNIVVTIFKILQLIRAAGKQSGYRLPEAVKTINEYLALITFDYDFLKPGCGKNPTAPSFSELFWGNAVVIVCLVAPSLIALLVLRVVHRARREFYTNRIFRAITIYLTLLYFVVATRVFQAVHCQRLGARLVLKADPNIDCSANGVFIVGWLGALLFTAGTPIGFVFFLLRLKKRNQLTDKTQQARYGYMYDGLRLDMYRFMFGVLPFFHLLFVALAWTVFPNTNAPYIFSILSFCCIILATLSWRPYVKPLNSAIIIVSYGVGLVSVVANLMTLSTSQATGPAGTGAVIGVIVIVLLLAVGMVFYEHRTAKNKVAPLSDLKDVSAGSGNEDSPRKPTGVKPFAPDRKSDAEEESTPAPTADASKSQAPGDSTAPRKDDTDEHEKTPARSHHSTPRSTSREGPDSAPAGQHHESPRAGRQAEESPRPRREAELISNHGGSGGSGGGSGASPRSVDGLLPRGGGSPRPSS